MYYVLGRGSNVIVPDAGTKRIILHMGKDFSDVKVFGDVIMCQAGASLTEVCKAAESHSLTGIEPLYGIPGSIGGAAFMNAGAYGTEISDLIISVSALKPDSTMTNYIKDDCGYSYRSSNFKTNKNIISSIKLKLIKGESEQISERMTDFLNRRKQKQPLEYPSAGSAFKRPEGNFASALIDDTGLKGLKIGGAQVSTKHAGFIINTGGATASDIKDLMSAVIEKVKARSGVTLEPEPIFWD
jgi:UDP-N-acetylmuramate dehydrogenase